MMAESPDDAEMLDSHTHAWRRWPYAPLVPDEDSRGTIGQLLYQLDLHGTTQAVVACAAITNNADNLDYVTSASDRYPGRLHILADLDCAWSPSYHTPGSADRLAELDERYELLGFTHYTKRHNDGWFATREADRLFRVAAQRGLIVSLAASPAWSDDVRRLAMRHPGVPVLWHHLGGVSAGDAPGSPGLARVLAAAEAPSIMIKVSGFPYCSVRGWDHPWPDAIAVCRRIYEVFGPERLCWGSDFPAGTRYGTYTQALEAVRTHCDFLSAADLRLILGGNLRKLIERRAAGTRPGAGGKAVP